MVPRLLSPFRSTETFFVDPSKQFIPDIRFDPNAPSRREREYKQAMDRTGQIFTIIEEAGLTAAHIDLMMILRDQGHALWTEKYDGGPSGPGLIQIQIWMSHIQQQASQAIKAGWKPDHHILPGGIHPVDQVAGYVQGLGLSMIQGGYVGAIIYLASTAINAIFSAIKDATQQKDKDSFSNAVLYSLTKPLSFGVLLWFYRVYWNALSKMMTPSLAKKEMWPQIPRLAFFPKDRPYLIDIIYRAMEYEEPFSSNRDKLIPFLPPILIDAFESLLLPDRLDRDDFNAMIDNFYFMLGDSNNRNSGPVADETYTQMNHLKQYIDMGALDRWWLYAPDADKPTVAICHRIISELEDKNPYLQKWYMDSRINVYGRA